ncbi:arginyltransferase [Methylotenera oryzisoli]|uniref:Aspartate/glutamate leucyltransferase n=1 Tax=Methylotenera oryzisoli TaxID=2080758 RepID=A0A4Y9VTM1_9PROT|nr:arginyltransferase [Methylotenera oryzisoli]TFW72982.1 arginyltransferase [Methylotenera oryzisoli]
MSLPSDTPLHKLQFYVTTGYTCGYLPNRMAQSLIAAPQHLVDANVYSGLIQQGFRRSGKFSYRPHCENCQECVPVRVVLEKFSPNRSQKRAFKQHQNLTATILPVGFHEEHYALYASYQRARHSDDKTAEQTDSDSQENNVEQYQSFLCQSNVESVLIEFREGDQLKMVSVIDIVRDGISAVYTFYDTSDNTTSYGTYNILWQALWAQTLDLPYLYLGYWIKDSRKMAYKQNYRPLEKLIDGEWR